MRRWIIFLFNWNLFSYSIFYFYIFTKIIIELEVAHSGKNFHNGLDSKSALVFIFFIFHNCRTLYFFTISFLKIEFIISQKIEGCKYWFSIFSISSWKLVFISPKCLEPTGVPINLHWYRNVINLLRSTIVVMDV